MLGILFAMRKWYQYLLSKHFIVKIDQQSIKFLLDQCFRQESQHSWLHKLGECDYITSIRENMKM